jgi:hypothetical protein
MFGSHSDSAVKEQKKLNPKDAMAQKIEAISGSTEMVFKLGQIYVKPFITVALNPEKGKKFIVFQEAAGTDGKPGGKRGKFWETNNAKEIAGWVLEREGSPYQA